MMSASAEGVSNHTYEYLFLARSGARSQSDLDEMDSKQSRQLRHGRSVDTYVEMNTVFTLPPEEDRMMDERRELHRGRSEDYEKIDEYRKREDPEVPCRELHRGKSEELDRHKLEPVAITAMYENMVVKAQNPRRKLRRTHDRDQIYEQYDFHETHPSSAPETYLTSTFLSIKSSQEDLTNCVNETDKPKKVVKLIHIPLSPTHYNQPPTPDHPPPSVLQAEKSIHDRIRPLSQVSS